MLNKPRRNNARFMFHVRAYKFLLVLKKKVDKSKCGNLTRRKILLVVGKVLIFLLVTRIARAHKNKMKEAELA
jgi:hypothetical protein